ncbi:uncharacterized protein LODBEIA_P56540 [Lodderomyces beijingensis]|uniref:Xylanolytic transcriptional activator regulatory domain-containing protein n=1 Tax=Lodderomyces beijingensis TaxID=1775926 RepID=A0ABP0ZWT7_9ASCO
MEGEGEVKNEGNLLGGVTSAPATEKEPSRVNGHSTLKPEKMQSLTDSRLSKLEAMMFKLSQSVELLVESSIVAQGKTDLQAAATTSRLTDKLHSRESLPTDSSKKSRTGDSTNTTSTVPTTADLDKHGEHYVGTHSIWCMFSKESLDWMEGTIGKGGADFITPVRNLPILFHMKCKSFVQKWIDPPLVDQRQKMELLETPFLSDPKTLITELISVHYKDATVVKMLVGVSRLKDMFDDYYRKKRKFKVSEFLIMTSCLLVSSVVKIEKRVDRETDKYLRQLQRKWLDNAIFYYQRLNVVSDGIETIEAISLLIVYLESSWITGHFNYIPLTVAIRYAQEMGFHRSESLQNLDLKEQERRRLLWWFCQFLDTEMCFKTGKPPAINVEDVSTNADVDMLRFCIAGAGSISHGTGSEEEEGAKKDRALCDLAASEALFGDESQPLRLRLLKEMRNICDDQHYYYFFSLLLTRIRSKSYHLLFSASAQLSDFRSLSNTLNELNRETFELGMWSHEDDRPRFYNEREFKFMDSTWSTDKREFILSNSLIYFSHLMIINRVPFMVRSENFNFDDAIIQYRNLSLDSARTILCLISQLNSENSPSYYNWVVNYAVSAFLILAASILNHPHSSEAGSDIKLLIDSTSGFFSSTLAEAVTFDGLDDLSISLVIHLMLNIIVKVYQDNTQQTVPGFDQQSSAKIKQRFPILYQDFHLTKNIVGTSPFNVNEAIAVNRHSASNSTGSISQKNSPYAHSPRYNPAVSNIITGVVDHPQTHQSVPLPANKPSPFPNQSFVSSHPSLPVETNTSYVRTGQTPMGQSPGPLSGFANNSYDFFAQGAAASDGGLSSVLMSQMNSLPNFFFDNNLGI